MQDLQKLDEFCLVMEAWFLENGRLYRILDCGLTCHIWQARSKGLVAENMGLGAHDSELSFAVKALEMYGRPPVPTAECLAMKEMLEAYARERNL